MYYSAMPERQEIFSKRLKSAEEIVDAIRGDVPGVTVLVDTPSTNPEAGDTFLRQPAAQPLGDYIKSRQGFRPTQEVGEVAFLAGAMAMQEGLIEPSLLERE